MNAHKIFILKKACATTSISVLVLRSKNTNIFKNLSTTTKIIEGSVEVGISVKISIAIFYQSAFPIGMAYNKPFVAWVSTFVL